MSKMIENANKVAFLVKQYPDHTLTQIIGLLGMPSIEINTAIWKATELGYITELDTETQKVALGPNAPEVFEFGDTVNELMEMITFSFGELAKKEQDLEENYVSNWTMGYASHDVLIALAHLVNTRVLATYDLTDPKDTESTYTFFSLYENGEQMWGKKQFKQEPTGEEVPTTPDDIPEEDKALAAEQAENDTTTTTTTQPGQQSLLDEDNKE